MIFSGNFSSRRLKKENILRVILRGKKTKNLIFEMETKITVPYGIIEHPVYFSNTIFYYIIVPSEMQRRRYALSSKQCIVFYSVNPIGNKTRPSGENFACS